MSASCCASASGPPSNDPKFLLVLRVALGINIAMFAAEIIGSIIAGSSALQADAIDFLADAFNYGISLSVAGLALAWRARAALVKGATMGLFGLGVLLNTAWHAVNGGVPRPELIGLIGIVALIANTGVAAMLFAHRAGDSNMRSIWLCSRNDVIANVAVLMAALGVLATRSAWPDIVVGAGIAALEISSAAQVVRQALGELRPSRLPVAAE